MFDCHAKHRLESRDSLPLRFYDGLLRVAAFLELHDVAARALNEVLIEAAPRFDLAQSFCDVGDACSKVWRARL
jgi:hypothetical protein